MPRPFPGSRWFATDATTVVEIVADRRYTKNLCVRGLNHLRNAPSEVLSPKQFEGRYQAQPRVPLSWINEGSVWRPLREADPSVSDLVVVEGVSAGGGLRAYTLTAEGGLGGPHNSTWSASTVYEFTSRHARLWAPKVVDAIGILIHPEDPNDDDEQFPQILHNLDLMPLPPVEDPEEDANEDLRETLAGDPAFEAGFALGQAAARSAAPKKKRKKRRKPRKKVDRRSAWDRLLDD